ncbi:Helix-turn-helix [Aerococcus urinaehominis]|uniref:helix-turn-helix transcriptional regulator n=1 Tax=Aerococcus urinaehominis TaxID=128944 RepID=UPI00088E137B|nr:helix-turn-helix transcriptional regulator [Aerococcus urinaehominis]SDM44961.1 Helix-turn-helix [Aerococcus urinaehominis]
MHLGDKLRSLRKSNGYSQEEIAEKLNVSRQTVSNWENFKSQPRANQLYEFIKLKA